VSNWNALEESAEAVWVTLSMFIHVTEVPTDTVSGLNANPEIVTCAVPEDGVGAGAGVGVAMGVGVLYVGPVGVAELLHRDKPRAATPTRIRDDHVYLFRMSFLHLEVSCRGISPLTRSTGAMRCWIDPPRGGPARHKTRRKRALAAPTSPQDPHPGCRPECVV
jgi:hypothetical protein